MSQRGGRPKRRRGKKRWRKYICNSDMSQMPKMGSLGNQYGDVNKHSDGQPSDLEHDDFDILSQPRDKVKVSNAKTVKAAKGKGWKKRKAEHNEGVSPDEKRMNANIMEKSEVDDDDDIICVEGINGSVSDRTRSKIRRSSLPEPLDLEVVAKLSSSKGKDEKREKSMENKSDGENEGILSKVYNKAYNKMFGGGGSPSTSSKGGKQGGKQGSSRERLSVNCINSPGVDNDFMLYGMVQDGKTRIVQESSSESSTPGRSKPGLTENDNKKEDSEDDDDKDDKDDFQDASPHLNMYACKDDKKDFKILKDDDTDVDTENDESEEENEENVEVMQFEDDSGLARMMRSIIQQENKKLEKRIKKFEEKVVKDMKSETDKTYNRLVKAMAGELSKMEGNVEKKVVDKLSEKYDNRFKEYEKKVKSLESELRNKETAKISKEDMDKVKHSIMEDIRKSKSFAQGIDGMVKQRIEKKIQEGELGVNTQSMNEVKNDIKGMKDIVGNIARDVEILNPDPFNQEHLCVVCSGVPFIAQEDPVDTAIDILSDLKNVLDDNDEKFDCKRLKVIGAKRLGNPNTKTPLLKIALASQEQKIAILKAKRYLAKSEMYSRVRIRTTKDNTTRAMEDNMLLMKELVPGLDEYRLAGNSRLVLKDRESEQTKPQVRHNAGRGPRGARGSAVGRGGNSGPGREDRDAGGEFGRETRYRAERGGGNSRGPPRGNGGRGRGGRRRRGAGRPRDSRGNGDSWGDEATDIWRDSDRAPAPADLDDEMEYPRLNGNE